MQWPFPLPLLVRARLEGRLGEWDGGLMFLAGWPATATWTFSAWPCTGPWGCAAAATTIEAQERRLRWVGWAQAAHSGLGRGRESGQPAAGMKSLSAWLSMGS